MSKPPPSNKKSEYEKQREIWYKKLKKSGFEDIEQDEDHLRSWSNKFVARLPPTEVWQAKQAYYSMAEKFLNDYKFKNNIDRIIWEYHSNGISMRDISKILLKVRKKDIGRTTIWNKIKQFEQLMYRMYVNTEEDGEPT